jgi:hypothetical protein
MRNLTTMIFVPAALLVVIGCDLASIDPGGGRPFPFVAVLMRDQQVMPAVQSVPLARLLLANQAA